MSKYSYYAEIVLTPGTDATALIRASSVRGAKRVVRGSTYGGYIARIDPAGRLPTLYRGVDNRQWYSSKGVNTLDISFAQWRAACQYARANRAASAGGAA